MTNVQEKYTSICYCTDVEGNLDYFERWVALSKHLVYEDDKKTSLNFVDDYSKFVFGGDVCDKGLGSMRIVRQLLKLRARYPDRVVFILGNRDLNKIRFTSELANNQIGNPALLEKLEGPYYVKEPQRVSPKHFLSKLIEKQGLNPTEINKLDTKVNRLKYMLDCTMGSAGDFERRRKELEIMSPGHSEKITDDDVVKSYLDWVMPGGEMDQFLRHGVLAYFDRATQSLFLHGGLPNKYGYVPGKTECYTTIEKWIAELNKWLTDELASWAKNPCWVPGRENDANGKNGDWSARGGNRIIAYVAPDCEPTVVYGDMFSPSNNIQQLPTETVSLLNSCSVRRIVVGHKPHGFCPSVMKNANIEVICADTSYSDMKSPDCRGIAVSNVLITKQKVSIYGVVSDGAGIEYDLSSDPTVLGDPFVGREVVFKDGEQGWWVKAKLKPKSDGTSIRADGAEYILQKVDGFKVDYAYVKRIEIVLKETAVESKIVPVQTVVRQHGANKFVLQTSIDPSVISLERVYQHPPFQNWLGHLTAEPNLEISKIHVEHVDFVGPCLDTIKVKISCVSKDTRRDLTSTTMIRGSTVVLLILIECPEIDQPLALIVSNSKIPSGHYLYYELPSATPNWDGSLGGPHVSLLMKEGFDLEQMDHIVDLTEFFYKGFSDNSVLQDEPAPAFLNRISRNPCRIHHGASFSDSSYQVLFCSQRVTPQQYKRIQEVDSQERLIQKRGEMFLLAVEPETLFAQCPDAKTFVAFSLLNHYQKKSGLRNSMQPRN